MQVVKQYIQHDSIINNKKVCIIKPPKMLHKYANHRELNGTADNLTSVFTVIFCSSDLYRKHVEQLDCGSRTYAFT